MWKLKETESNLWSNSSDRRESSNERLIADDRRARYTGYDFDMDREEDSLGSALARYKRASDGYLGGSRDEENLRPRLQDLSHLDEREAYDPYIRGSSSRDFRSRKNNEDEEEFGGSGSFRRRGGDYSPELRRRRSPSPGPRWSKERESRSREYSRRSRSRSRSGGQRRPSSTSRRDSRRRSPAPSSYRRRSPDPRSGSYRSSRSKDRESSGGRESSSATRNAVYLSQAPSNMVVMKNIPPHCGEEDIRQEVEVFGAPVKDIRLIRKGGFSKDPDIQVVSSLSKSTRGSSPSSSVWAYLEFLRLEDAQRWMEQSQGRLRIRGDWVEMMYDEPEAVTHSRDRDYNTSSVSRRRRRSRSPVSRSRSRSRSKRRRGMSPPSSDRSTRSSRRMSPDSGSRRSGDSSYRPPKDWDCFNCNGRNYPRRLECYRCGVSREESEKSRTDLSLLQITSRPTKYLVIRELDPLTTDETLQLNLTRLSPVFVRQAYVSRDPVLQVSNGYAYVELNNESEAEKLKTFLEQKKFAIDSKRVAVHYSKSCGDEAVKALHGNPHTPTLYNEPKNVPPRQNYENEEELKKNPLIQAAHSDYSAANGSDPSRMDSNRKRRTPTTTDGGYAAASSSSSSHTHNSSAAAVTETVNVNGQLYPVFPVPNTALYMYDQNSGYYYDPQTMLYYDANTRYYYNSTTQQFLYWDGHYSTYLPLSAQQQEAAKNQQQQQASSDPSSTKQDGTPTATSQQSSVSDASQLGENRGSVSFSFSANAKKPDKSHNVAKKVREDMERWTKSINSLKKMETPRSRLQLSEDPSSNPGGANNSESSSTWGSSAASSGVGASNAAMGTPSLNASGSSVADAAFAALEKRNMLGGMDQQGLNESPYDPNAEFKKVLLDPKPATALSPFSGIGNDEDHSASNENNISIMSSATYQNPAPQAAVATPESEELRLTDWSKLACLLCQRQFKDRDTLIKHQKLSDLHKSNMEEHMKNLDPSTGSNSQQQSDALLGSEDSLASMLQYRDRAKERREKHGISAPPLREHEKATSSAASISQSAAPEKQPIGRKNVGNKLMQAMGWKEGEGLGRSKQGITAPISATGRDTTAGLGANVYTRDPNKTYAENARQALLSRIKNDM